MADTGAQCAQPASPRFGCSLHCSCLPGANRPRLQLLAARQCIRRLNLAVVSGTRRAEATSPRRPSPIGCCGLWLGAVGRGPRERAGSGALALLDSAFGPNRGGFGCAWLRGRGGKRPRGRVGCLTHFGKKVVSWPTGVYFRMLSLGEKNSKEWRVLYTSLALSMFSLRHR